MVGGVQAGGSQGLTILEQITVEGILGHTVHLGRTASVVDGTMCKRALDVVLVQDHLLVTGEVKRVEVSLVVAVQGKVARVHDLLTGLLGLSEVLVGAVIVLGHILAVVTLVEANLSLHGQSNPLVEGNARAGVVGDVGASEVHVLKHLVHHLVTGLTGTVQDIFIIGIKFLVHPVAVTIVADNLVVLPCTVQATDTQPVGLLGIAHRLYVGHSGNKGIGAADFHIGSVPRCSATGNIHVRPLGDTGRGLVIIQGVEVVVTTAASITREGVIEIVGEQLDVGLTGKIVVLGELIIGIGVENIIARSQ